MLKLYFVRHGQTEWNVIKKLQGLKNSPLTEEGVEQTELLYEKLKHIDFEKVYTSPQGRAKHTAQILKGERELEIIELEDIMEMSFGDIEGLEREEFKARYKTEFNNLWTNAVAYDPKPFNGENFKSLEKRAINGLKKIIEKNEKNILNKEVKDKDINIMIVSHGMILKVIFGYVLGHGLDKFWDDPVPQNTSVSIVTYKEGNLRMKDFSNIDHLDNPEEISYI